VKVAAAAVVAAVVAVAAVAAAADGDAEDNSTLPVTGTKTKGRFQSVLFFCASLPA